MDIIKAYTFITEERDWITKILLGAVIVFFFFLIIPLFLINGYKIAVARRVKDGDEELLPEWGDDIGKLFIDGVVLWVAQFVYALPVILLVVCSALLIIPAAVTAGEVDFSAASGAAIGGSIAMICIGAIYGLFMIILIPAVTIQYVRTDDFGAMFRFGEVFAVARDNFVDILLTVIADIVAGMIFGLLGIIPICGWVILIYVVPVWRQAAIGNLYGQIAAKIEAKPLDAAFAA